MIHLDWPGIPLCFWYRLGAGSDAKFSRCERTGVSSAREIGMKPLTDVTDCFAGDDECVCYSIHESGRSLGSEALTWKDLERPLNISEPPNTP